MCSARGETIGSAKQEGVAVGDGRAKDFFNDMSVAEDPYSYYEYAQSQGPVWREPFQGVFVVTGYDEMVAVYRDPEVFSSCNSFGGPFPGLPESPAGDDATTLIETYRDIFPSHESLVTFDPPVHSDHRGLMMRLLTPKRLKENEDFMWRLADQLIDGFIAEGKCDFISEYAYPFAMLVIADLLGVPESDQPELRRRMVANGPAGAVGQRMEGNFLAHLEEFFSGYIEDRRRDPRDDVLGKMAMAPFADGSLPEVIDVVRVATILFAGGQGTAARFLGNEIRQVAEDHDLQAQLRAERHLIPSFVEETLRLYSPVKSNFRMARHSAELAGVQIPAGSTLMLLLGAADRDGRRFECPAEFDMDRANVREHIAFGRGIHSCPGAPLVRADGRITLERMLDRLADIRVSEAEHGPPEARRYDYTPTYILRGLEALHLEFTPIG
jgi:cytochrome P450